MIRSKDSLEFHAAGRPGKIEVRAGKPCLTPRDIRMAYLPGASFPAEEIIRDPQAVYRYTGRGNLVGVVTNGSAVPGLGDVGPSAAKPMQEGIAVLFKRLADIDVFDLELDTRDADAIVETVARVAPTFGGISLKDIRAPEGLAVHERLSEMLSIPVLHENLSGTALVAAAALTNMLELAEKRIEDVKVVVCGASTVGLGCARLLCRMGLPREQLWLYDVRGLLHPERSDLNRYQREFARSDGPATLAEGLRGADVFVGASVGGTLNEEMVRSMARFPAVLAMATPEPEITREAARAARRDVLVATSETAEPNAIVDLLGFPYVLRGALDVQATRITDGMLLAAARALAELAKEDVVEEVSRAYGYEPLSFGPDYLLPRPIDPRVLVWESSAVAAQAIEEGVAERPVEIEHYREALATRIGTGRETMRQMIFKARQEDRQVVLSDGTHETVLRACRVLLDEGIATPILLGAEEEIQLASEQLGLDLAGVKVVDPARSPRREDYAEAYYAMRRRRGVTRETARRRLTLPEYFAALMLHAGDADVMLGGLRLTYPEALRTIIEVVGTAPGVSRLASHHMVLRPRGAYFLADCAVNIEPDAAALAEIALLTARQVRLLGVEPRIAMLSFSNFGSVDHPHTRRVREATAIVKERAPELIVDGEMQLRTAVDRGVREAFFPFSELPQDANVLVFPDLHSGSLALHLLDALGDAISVGPILTGARLPAQALPHGASVEDIVHLAATGIVEAAGA